jgi:hypothetical protein
VSEERHFDNVLFTRVCTLEATLELNTKKLYETEQKLVEIEKLLRQALKVIIDTNRVANTLQDNAK